MPKSNTNTLSKRGPLGELVVNIEFIIISIVQGAAITTLAAQTAGYLTLDDWQVWPYILTGFLFAMFFWSEAIGHTLGFIDWPLSLPHTFLYFLVGFLEMIAFIHVADPLVWFGVFFVLTLVGLVLYVVDFSIIKQQHDQIAVSPAGEQFYADLIRDQKRGLYMLTPLALSFNALTLWLFVSYAAVFLTDGWHVVLVSLQALITLSVLLLSVHTFRTRSEVLAELYGTYEDKLKK